MQKMLLSKAEHFFVVLLCTVSEVAATVSSHSCAYFHATLLFLLLLEEFLERAPEASFVLLPTPLAERGVVILLCRAPPL